MQDKAYSKTLVENWSKAIIDRDVVLAKLCLDQGMKPNMTILNDGIENNAMALLPMEYLLLNDYPDHDPDGVKTEALFELLLEKDKTLVDTNAYADIGVRYMVDTCLPSPHARLRSRLIAHTLLHTLERGLEPYEVDQNQIVRLGLDRVNELRDAFLAHVADEETVTERKLMRDYYDEWGFWQEDIELYLDFPASNPLPGKVMLQLPNGLIENLAEVFSKSSSKADLDPVKSIPMRCLERTTPEKVLRTMNESLVGLDHLKSHCNDLYLRLAFNKARAQLGLRNPHVSQTMLLTGPPGTGKTSFFRLYAQFLCANDLIGDKYLEVTRDNLVGRYLGQTENDVREMIEQADFIFIDEAYDLVSDYQSDYGNRVLSVVMKALENDRTEKAFGFAGYRDQMEGFLNANPGLRSRIPNQLHIEPYTKADIQKVLDHQLKQFDYTIEPRAREELVDRLEKHKNQLGPKLFGNARDVRSVVESLQTHVARRVCSKPGWRSLTNKKALTQIIMQDVLALKMPEIHQKKNGIGFGASLG